MDTRTRGEYVFVVVCFCLSWLAIVGTIGFWYFHVVTPPFQRAIFSGLFVAIATVGALIAITWATDRHERIMFVEKGPQTSASSRVPTMTEPKPTANSDKPHSHPVSREVSKTGPIASLEMELTPVISLESVQLYVDLNFVNVGQLAARKIVRLHRGAIGHVVQPEDETKVKQDVDALWKEFETANAKEPLGTNDIGIQQKGYWRYNYSDFKFTRPLTVDILKDIEEGRTSAITQNRPLIIT